MRQENFSSEQRIAVSQYKKEKKYWVNKLSGDLVSTGFYNSYNNKKTVEPVMKTEKFKLSGQLFSRLMKLANQSDPTLHMILAAAVVLLLNKYTGSEDIPVTTPIDKQEVKGVFINTVLLLRTRVGGGMTFKELLLRVRQTVNGAIENQNYPVETLIPELHPQYDEDDFPVFHTVVLLKNIQDKHDVIHVKPGIIFSFLRTGEYMEGELEYNSLIYEKTMAEKMVNHFINLMQAALFNLDLTLSQIDILSKEEKQKIIYDFNNTAVKYPQNNAIHEIFAEQADRLPGNTALVYKNSQITYRELNRKANRLARGLILKGVKQNQPVGLMVERSIEMITAILGILKAGAAYLPIDPDYPRARREFILEESAASLMLTRGHLQEQNNRVDILLVEDKDLYVGDGSDPGQEIGRNDLAYVIYTSGSTGTPRGVMIEHSSVINLVFSQLDTFKIDANERILQFSSICFDASVEQIFIALAGGSALVLIDKDVILDNKEFEESMIKYSITHLHAVPSFLNQIEVKNAYNLKRVISGGDVCSLALAQKWREYYKFYNEYGPTETTVTSIEFPLEQAREKGMPMPVGKPIMNTTLYLLDRYLNPVPPGVEGELYLGGAGAARGYMNNPELTAEKFIASPFDKEDRLFRSGDLAKWLPDDNLEFIGRKDNQVKIRGFRIELGEIESLLLMHEEITEAAVIVRGETSENRYICAYIVSDQPLNENDLKEYLSGELPGYMIPLYIVPLAQLPLTPNGKIDRKTLTDLDIKTGEKYTAPRDELEAKLLDIWEEVLEIDKNHIGIGENFFELGGHSLKSTAIISKIHKMFNVKIPLLELFKNPTVMELARYLKDSKEDKFASIQPAEEKEYYVLSSAQKRLYILQQMQSDYIVYNIPAVLELQGELDMRKLTEVFNRLKERHESLRTSFFLLEEEPVQKIHRQVELDIEYFDVPHGSSLETKDVIRNFVRHFDLAEAPLLRVGLLAAPGKNILLLDMHHVISDGASARVLINDFMALYSGEELGPLRLRYKDYAEWQTGGRQRQLMKQQESYWLNVFSDELPVLNLPTDYNRPKVQTFAGDSVNFELTREETEALKDIARQYDATFYMIILAVLNVLFSKLGGQDDIIIGSPIAGRRHVDLDHIMGMFVNMLALRNYPAGNKPFSGLLKELAAGTLEAFENQDYQFDDLADKVDTHRDGSRNPIFDVVFSYKSQFEELENILEKNIPGLLVKQYQYENKTVKFDILLHCFESTGSTSFRFEYNVKLFREETIERFIAYIKTIISSILEDPEKTAAEIEIISTEDRQRLVEQISKEKSKLSKLDVEKEPGARGLKADFEY